MSQAKKIGIVAVSAEGAALCYRTICDEGPELMGSHRHPEVCLHTFSLSDYMQPIYADDWSAVGDRMLESARILVNAGAEFLICPDNTVHQGLAFVREKSPAPWLHIAEEVATVASDAGYRKLGVLGTRWLMEGPVYRDCLTERELSFEIPDHADRVCITDVIMNELVYGRFEAPARHYFQDVISKLAARGCDAVVLGCTEIPLLIGPDDACLPVLDSTRILARAALRRSVD